MSEQQDWRIGVNAEDYFGRQKKTLALENRRPVIRQASDLVGPGIGANAVRITDYSDTLATFNGYYSSAPGALHAPNEEEAFIGYVISDAALGGKQVFTGMDSGIEFSRTFSRSPEDPTALGWGTWTGQRIPPTVSGDTEVDSAVPTASLTLLFAPNIEVIGEPGTYNRTPAAIQILRQGVYTGSIQVGDRAGSTVSALYIYKPDGGTTSGVTQLAVPLGPTVHIPFTVWATDGEQAFSVAAFHSSGDTRDLWWRFSCTRVGDAI